jgi:hypothetical protein
MRQAYLGAEFVDKTNKAMFYIIQLPPACVNALQNTGKINPKNR